MRHAFASARARVELYDEERVREALLFLGQKDLSALTCVYCEGPATTWDHLQALVSKKAPSGFGHTLGNLVPACAACNSERGNRPWEPWMRGRGVSSDQIQRVGAYHERYLTDGSTHSSSELSSHSIARLQQIEEQIIELMREADDLLAETRAATAGTSQDSDASEAALDVVVRLESESRQADVPDSAGTTSPAALTRQQGLKWLSSQGRSRGRHVAVSKRYRAEEARLGVPGWWLEFPTEVVEPSDQGHVDLLCAASNEPAPASPSFHHLRVPIVFLAENTYKLHRRDGGRRFQLYLSADHDSLFQDLQGTGRVDFAEHLIEN